MASTNPVKIRGEWKDGYALDVHTLSSEFLGYDEFGNARFETKRSDLGELLYQLKYNRNADALQELAKVAAAFVAKWKIEIDAIVPVPPTRARRPQPLFELANALAKHLGLPVFEGAVRAKNITELKNVFDYGERMKLLEGSYSVKPDVLKNKSILLLDDLFRSGATMNAVAKALYEQAECATVYALAMTRTRLKR